MNNRYEKQRAFSHRGRGGEEAQTSAPIFGTIAMKNKESLVIADGVAKRPGRQPRRNPNRATPVDDEIPLHDGDLAKTKTSRETGRTKLAIEDKPKTVVAPRTA